MEKYSFTPEQRAVLEGMRAPFAICQLIDRRAVPLILSDGFCELFGYEDKARAYRELAYDMLLAVHPDDAARVAEVSARFEAGAEDYEVITRVRTGGKGYRVVHACGRHVSPAEGVRLIHLWYTDEGVYDENTGSENAKLAGQLVAALHEESILQVSRFDQLTGLPNLTHFFELADAGKERIERGGGVPVLLFFNLNGMRFFNQNHSFAEGDKLLRDFALLLTHTFGSECCCRAAADHFIALSREDGLEETLEGIFRACHELNAGDAITVKVGIYSARFGTVAVSTACDRAKLASDSLKGTYSSAFRYYSEKLSHDAENKQYILENLDRALEERWIEVYYQPIVRAMNGRVCDEESLARWNDPVKGLLSPAEFIPVLEEAGLISRLDLYIVDRVLEKIKCQEQEGLTVVPHSVNLSRMDFDDCDIVEEIRRRVDEAGMSRKFITIEITESTLGSDFDFIREQVGRFRELGFAVWMDDFGSGYSSLDVLQSVRFDLLKFDMGFIQKLDSGTSGRVILTELIKMAIALGIDTVCEGVETEEQVRFLQEIGCSKLQGFYYCRPIPFEALRERYASGRQIGYENPAESAYYGAVSRVNLYDLSVVAHENENAFQNFFDMVPMCILEVGDKGVRFLRTNRSFREFMVRFFGLDLSDETEYAASSAGPGSAFVENIRNICGMGCRAFFDEKMADGSVVHAFARKIGENPAAGTAAAAVAVLSITDPDDGASYAAIARALAADYYNIYFVDLETDRFIEYSSPAGGEGLAVERHGEDFFGQSLVESDRIYEEDREIFYAAFTKENILRQINEHGVFTTTYRLVDTGVPVYVQMKISRMEPGSSRIILGVSNVDAPMKQRQSLDMIRRERDTLARIMALAEDYLSLYTVDPVTGEYVQYTSSQGYETLGLNKSGEDFFQTSLDEIGRIILPEDLPAFRRRFSKENILRAVREEGSFKLQYRLVIDGKPKRVGLKIGPFRDGEEEKLLAGVRAWRERTGC